MITWYITDENLKHRENTEERQLLEKLKTELEEKANKLIKQEEELKDKQKHLSRDQVLVCIISLLLQVKSVILFNTLYACLRSRSFPGKKLNKWCGRMWFFNLLSLHDVYQLSNKTKITSSN